MNSSAALMLRPWALILAGGRSSRMGRDKALLPVDGARSLLYHIAQVAQAVADPVQVLTPWPQRYEMAVPAGVQIVQEVPLPGAQETFHGPAAALVQGMVQGGAGRDGVGGDRDSVDSLGSARRWVLVLACDLPGVSVAQVEAWWQQVQTETSEPTVWLPFVQGRWHPLCGFYHPRCYPELTAYVAAGGRSLQGWLAGQAVGRLTLADPHSVVNVNTPAEWQQWQGQQGD